MPVLESESVFNAAVLRYAQEHGHWQFAFSAEASVNSFRFLRELDCDGAIVRIVSPEMREEALRVDLPMVNVSSWLEHPGVTTIRFDNEMLGRLSAEHLLERKFQRFGIVRLHGGWLNEERARGFLASVGAAGFGDNVSIFDLQSQFFDRAEMNRFRAWASSLRPPTGIFLTDDENAPLFMEALRAEGLRIPQDVAVITGYHHPLYIRDCVPPLTHIDIDDEALALKAAQCLDRLMKGESPPNAVNEVQPRGVVALRSTDTLAVDDPMVSRAVEFIREHSAENINIKVVAEQLSLQRRTLERRFAAAVGISLHQFMIRERVMRAETLLRSSTRPALSKIASQCGFFDARHMKRALRQAARPSR